jgi:hypothetical protein
MIYLFSDIFISVSVGMPQPDAAKRSVFLACGDPNDCKVPRLSK